MTRHKLFRLNLIAGLLFIFSGLRDFFFAEPRGNGTLPIMAGSFFLVVAAITRWKR